MVTRNEGCDIPMKVCGAMSKCAQPAVVWATPDIASIIVAHDNRKKASRPVAKPDTMA